jgi:SAM-dependent methyltransferase
MNFSPDPGIDLVLFNTPNVGLRSSKYRVEIGDARDMSCFRDQQFDIVFSNSVIEHVGSFSDQMRMAREVARVGKRYFVQTPNRYFPIEPHFLFPCIQFLPYSLRAILVYRLKLGFGPPCASINDAFAAVRKIRLLNIGELQRAFVGASICRETFLGMTKSYIVYHGWE